jgi:hypothetical protein
MPRLTLFHAVERAIPVLLPLSRGIGRMPVLGPILRRLIPVANYAGIYPLNEQQLREWAVLDTFDMLAPAYDLPQTHETMQSWLKETGLRDIEIEKVGHLVARGMR